MMYLEFINRDRFMPPEIFYALGTQSAWKDPEDDLLGQIARTAGIGAQPSCIAFCRFNAFTRLDEWEQHFRSDKHRADRRMHAKHQAIEHYRAGCYDEIVPAARPLSGGMHYIESFSVTPDVSNQMLRDAFLDRQKISTEARLEFVIRRIGALAPEPGSMAVWTVEGFSEIEIIESHWPELPGVALHAAGTYRSFPN